jgi:hypothetical protein
LSAPAHARPRDAFPTSLRPSELRELRRVLAASLKATEVGRALASAGCRDPEPKAGKRRRLDAALRATQDRDGHAGALERLHSAVEEALRAREARDEFLVRLRVSPIRARARIATQAGVLEVGVVYEDPIGSLALALPGHDAAVVLTAQDSHELVTEICTLRRELAEREALTATGRALVAA